MNETYNKYVNFSIVIEKCVLTQQKALLKESFDKVKEKVKEKVKINS